MDRNPPPWRRSRSPRGKQCPEWVRLTDASQLASGPDEISEWMKWVLGRRVRRKDPFPHSHSIVPGGLLVTSYTTRFTPFTSLMMRVATWPMNFMSNG